MQEVTARRFIDLCNRLPVYQGVLAARVAAEEQEQQPDPNAPQEVSIDEINQMMPGLIERVEV